MEKIQSILEKLMKVMFIVGLFLGGTSIILLFKMHIKKWPMISNVYPEEIILCAGMVVVYLLAKYFKLRYFKLIAIAGIILSMVNLIGFRILYSLM